MADISRNLVRRIRDQLTITDSWGDRRRPAIGDLCSLAQSWIIAGQKFAQLKELLL